MAMLTQAGQQVLNGRNFITHTRVYVNDVLLVDTSQGVADTPVVGYQINRSRKLGAANLILNVANPGGIYSFNRQGDPLFGYGNKLKLQEGLPVGGTMEWFTRFTGIIVAQVAANMGGKPSLRVNVMDNMKLLLDYLPDELYYRPDIIAVKGEVLTEVAGGDYKHYRGTQDNLPWVDIPYPVFYKNGGRIKEDYEVDLINGEVYFGERMCGKKTQQATKSTDLKYLISSVIQPGFRVTRSFELNTGSNRQTFQNNTLPQNVTVSASGNELTFSGSPFADLLSSLIRQYTNKTINVTTETPYVVTADYWYYDDNTNLAEEVIRDLALMAGFKPAQIMLEPTGVSLKPMRFTNLTIQNAFEAIQKIKQQLPPNYIITCDTEGNLRGYYAAQKPTPDYELQLIKKIDAPVSEENLYTVVVAHGVDLNPNDLRSTATAQNLLLPSSIIKVQGTPASVLNKNTDDQISWHWKKKNNDVPPEFPIDLLTVTLAEAKKIEEINILVGDYNKGTIQESISVQVSEDGENWFYIDRSARGVTGASSQWTTLKGGELENRKIKGIKLIAEDAFGWTETHAYSSGGFLGIGSSVKTDNYYHWYLAVKEIQLWEENTISVTGALNNCIGIGDGVNNVFTLPNTPVVPGSVTVYRDGVMVAPVLYTVDDTTGEVQFTAVPPTGVITADYTVETKRQPRSQSDNNDRYPNNVTVINPADAAVFTGGAIEVNSANYKLLRKIGLKKNALKADNYLNSFTEAKQRGEEVLREISRLEETLDMDVVYRPDIDICQTVGIFDPLLGLADGYFIEEITESKQGFRPALNVKVSKY